MRSLIPVLSLVLFYNGVAALRSGNHCFDGCRLTLDYVDFNDTSPAPKKKIRSCQSVLHAKSLYLCINSYCEEFGREDWLRVKDETCLALANTTLPPYSIIANYTRDDLAKVHRLRIEETPVLLREIIIPDEVFFNRAFRTLVAAYFETDIHWLYGLCMFYFWFIIVCIGVGTRLISLVHGVRRQGWQLIPESEVNAEEQNVTQAYTIFSLPYALFKRFILVPATFGKRCSQNIGRSTVPPRIQSLTILSLVTLNIVLCSISYPVSEGNLYWPKVSDQLWRYMSDRTGIISLANFPLIWLFGMRNNFLLWLTGWSFGAYSNFHRWSARVATLQVVVHSIGYTYMIMDYGGWSGFTKYLQKHYFWNGELATIFMCTILVFSVYSLRRRHYEAFLNVHIVISFAVIITMYYHVEIFTKDEWYTFIYPCFAIWVADRLIRILRILMFNWKFWNTGCFATYDPNSNLVRLEIPCSRDLLGTKPGTYYYIYVLNDLLFAHQNHPFTLAYIAPSKYDAESRDEFAEILPLRRASSRHSGSSSSRESDSLLASMSPSSSSLVFLIRPYDGLTSRLRNLASMTAKPASLRVLVEGPYGGTTPLRDFPNVLFVVGGTGIAVPLSYLHALHNENSHAINIRIVWAVRSYALLIEVLERDFRGKLNDARVALIVHITQDRFKDDGVEGPLKVKKIKAGRPDVDAVVEEAAGLASQGSLAVMACGPAQMADDARRACVRALGMGWRGVEYFEESFKW
ncbi:hypothetical protein CC78DRAFT_515778 [Lojkania enalia]|uniref:FAD-binding FR-type domain-containing protein n=1 Tax=Lojkania enalia TaxID=147567 RepID=A0A9P4N4V2_9PLEO|nr:hypothetical protein CC78DRAFT_515778 [Didymosphaeria enalia]